MTHRFAFWSLGGALVALVLGSVLTLALLARGLGSERVIHTLAGNTSAIGTALRVQFERALTVGMSLNELVGVEPVFTDHMQRHREVSFFALLGADQKPLVFTASPLLSPQEAEQARKEWSVPRDEKDQSGALFRVVRTPIEAPDGSGTRGWLLTGYPANYIDGQVNAVVTDLFVAVLIALILTSELLRFGGSQRGWRLVFEFRSFLQAVKRGMLAVRSPLPHDGRWGQLGLRMNQRIEHLKTRYESLTVVPTAGAQPGSNAWHQRLQRWGQQHGLLSATRSWLGTQSVSHLRMLVFLTALSDELVRPIMAVHASQMDGPLALPSEALAGIPLTAFLLTWAFSQPVGASLLQRHGSRLCLTAATAVVAGAMLATALTNDWWVLTALRGVTGAGFGFLLIFSQTLMLRLGRESGRAAAIAEFVGAVVAAGICGPVIGGLMSVKLGVESTFAASGLCALAAVALAWRLVAVPAPEQRGAPLTWSSLAALLKHRKLMALLLCSAIPGKMAATAVLMLVVPLAVADMGEPASLTGRLLLLYFLGFLMVAGVAGRLSDRQQSRKPFVVMGGGLSALGCAAGYAIGGVWGLVFLTALLGLGQAWLSSAQIVWATQMADQDQGGTDAEVVLGIYRLVERFGGALGPVLVAALVTTQGMRNALVILGVALALGSLLLWLFLPTSSKASPVPASSELS